ncbi:SGNH hydrolase-type esterase domain-containing protein [Mycena crocata]|nr:SGNH hydrolase-type esterase domain-containing protein [Mycena crocata]
MPPPVVQPLPNSCLLSIPNLASELTLSSRWEYSDNGAIWTAWAGSSIKFHSNNLLSSLFMRVGPNTQRKDRWNGGTPMFAVSITRPAPPGSSSEAHSGQVVEIRTFDAEPGTLVQLWDHPIQSCLVEIVLIDWASIVEIEGFVSADPRHVEPTGLVADHQILFIGDSITCGLALEPSDGGEAIPCGILDAFPFQTVSILREKYSYPLSVDVVAYPGVSLVSIAQQTDDDSGSRVLPGMVDRFFHTNPWETTTWTPRGSPNFICIALGTNDEANDVEPQLFRSTLEHFIKTLSKTFSSVRIFYIVPPFRDFNEPGAGAIHSDLVSNPLVVGDIDIRVCEDIGSNMMAEHTVDGLHPNLAGHTLLADTLAQFLDSHKPPPEPEED